MRFDSDDCDVTALRPIHPEYSAGGWSVVLEVRLENFHPVSLRERVDFVALQARMKRVFLKVSDRAREFIRQGTIRS